MSYPLSQLSEATFPRLLKDYASASGWAEKRSDIEAVWRDYLGWMPDRPAISYTIHDEIRESDHVRVHLSYATGFGDRVTAYLLIPGSESSPSFQRGGRKYPAAIALHPTEAAGKDDVATSEGRANRRYALELVSRGYVVLAPDTITAGERIYAGEDAFRTAPFYLEFPDSTAIGKMLHDHQLVVDLLQTLPYVDGERIGAIGHSLGAYNAYFLAGMDERIKAVVSSCGFCPFMGDPSPNRWGQREWFSHMPRLTEDLLADRVPFEFHEIMALMAPRPLLNWFTQNDAIFPNWQAASYASLDIHRLYEALGQRHCYMSLIGNEGHDFPEHARNASYDFLDQWLRAEIPIK